MAQSQSDRDAHRDTLMREREDADGPAREKLPASIRLPNSLCGLVRDDQVVSTRTCHVDRPYNQRPTAGSLGIANVFVVGGHSLLFQIVEARNMFGIRVD